MCGDQSLTINSTKGKDASKASTRLTKVAVKSEGGKGSAREQHGTGPRGQEIGQKPGRKRRQGPNRSDRRKPG